MSYILDALRKADAERSRGTVPGIHDQPTFAAPVPTAGRPPARARWITALAVAGVAVAGACIGWFVLGGAGSRLSASAPAAAPPVALAAPAPAPAALPAPAVAPVAVAPPVPAPIGAAPPSAALAVAPPAVAPPPAPRRPARPRPQAVVPATPRAPGPGVDTRAGMAPGVSPVRQAAPAPADAGARVYAVNELPEDVRRALPNLNIGGSMYSNVPADRLLILNGQVLHEGDKITPELQLQRIGLKSAVLVFRGFRYAVTY